MEVWCRLTVVGFDETVRASWTLSGTGPPDLSVVDGLVSLILAARRGGHRTVLSDVCTGLFELLDLTGLRGQVIGQTEDGEQSLGVKEGMEPGDLAG